jgi:hypothetical protein
LACSSSILTKRVPVGHTTGLHALDSMLHESPVLLHRTTAGTAQVPCRTHCMQVMLRGMEGFQEHMVLAEFSPSHAAWAQPCSHSPWPAQLFQLTMLFASGTSLGRYCHVLDLDAPDLWQQQCRRGACNEGNRFW